MTDCNLEQLPNEKWWCPAPGCDDEKKRLLRGNYRRNCRSPEVNAEAKARQERTEANLAVCRECPISQWVAEEEFCAQHANNRCSFNKLLVSPMFQCPHWPEVNELQAQ